MQCGAHFCIFGESGVPPEDEKVGDICFLKNIYKDQIDKDIVS